MFVLKIYKRLFSFLFATLNPYQLDCLTTKFEKAFKFNAFNISFFLFFVIQSDSSRELKVNFKNVHSSSVLNNASSSVISLLNLTFPQHLLIFHAFAKAFDNF
jgi:hypothetical protein